MLGTLQACQFCVEPSGYSQLPCFHSQYLCLTRPFVREAPAICYVTGSDPPSHRHATTEQATPTSLTVAWPFHNALSIRVCCGWLRSVRLPGEVNVHSDRDEVRDLRDSAALSTKCQCRPSHQKWPVTSGCISLSLYGESRFRQRAFAVLPPSGLIT